MFVGDTFCWGNAKVQVSDPGHARPRDGTAYEIYRCGERTGRTGFYLRVLQSGEVSAADPLELVDIDPFGLSVADVTSVMCSGPEAAGLTLERVLRRRTCCPLDGSSNWRVLRPGHARS